MGHNNEVITKLFRQAKPVKVTIDNLPNIVDKIEQKAKVRFLQKPMRITDLEVLEGKTGQKNSI